MFLSYRIPPSVEMMYCTTVMSRPSGVASAFSVGSTIAWLCTASRSATPQTFTYSIPHISARPVPSKALHTRGHKRRSPAYSIHANVIPALFSRLSQAQPLQGSSKLAGITLDDGIAGVTIQGNNFIKNEHALFRPDGAKGNWSHVCYKDNVARNTTCECQVRRARVWSTRLCHACADCTCVFRAVCVLDAEHRAGAIVQRAECSLFAACTWLLLSTLPTRSIQS